MKVSILFLMLITSLTWASDVPLCPQTSSAILDERYPVSGVVVSTGSEEAFAPGVIYEVMKAYDFEQVPPIAVPTRNEPFQSMINKLKERLSLDGKSPKEIESLLSRIKHLNRTPYTWQQDYFESFFDPANGRPVIRENIRYLGKRGVARTATDLSKFLSEKESPVKRGKDYISWTKENMDADSGGNIEALPGGLCLVGQNQNPKTARQFCAEDDEVRINTDWLTVGHVDEIVKVVKDPTGEDPCNFNIIIASPQKAMEELKKNTTDYFFGDFPQNKDFIVENITFGEGHGALFCEMYIDSWIRKEEMKQQGPHKKSDGNKVKVVDLFSDFLMAKAYAGVRITRIEDDKKMSPDTQQLLKDYALARQSKKRVEMEMKKVEQQKQGVLEKFEDNEMTKIEFEKEIDRLDGNLEVLADEQDNLVDFLYDPDNQEVIYHDICPSLAAGLTNEDVFHAVSSGKIGKVNKLIQSELDKAKEIIEGKLAKRLPQCRGKYQVLDVPNLFFSNSAEVVENQNGEVSLEEYQANAITPNPTNGLLLNKSVLFSDPHSGAFRKSLEEVAAKSHLKSSFVDTWANSHVNEGNLHCSTHVIRHCRPNK
jgi:hypothetical protein